MEGAPSPSASNHHALHGIIRSLGTLRGRLLRLEVVVLLSAFILAGLVVHGSVSRRGSSNVLHGFMAVAYSMLPVAVSYAIGLIQDGPFHSEIFVLWATSLLLIQASAMSTVERKALLLQSAPAMGRCQQECVGGQRKKLLLQHIFQTGLVLWLIINASTRNACYRVVIWVFWALNVLKIAAKIVEVTREYRTDLSVKMLAEYMAVEEDGLPSDQQPNPVTMQGYQYIFHGEETMEPVIHDGGHPTRDDTLPRSEAGSVVTIDQVYKWIDDQQGSSEVEKDKARDFCLAFVLFKLLKRRFYGYIPAEAGSWKARDLVLTRFIYADDLDTAYRLVQAELDFLYEFLYTNNSLQAVVGHEVYLWIAVTVASVTISAAFFGTLAPRYHGLLAGVHGLDRSVTVLLVAITAGLEVCQAVAGFSAPLRRYVTNVYRCVRDDRPWKYGSIAPPETRYLEEKVGQYELLKRFRHRPLNLLSWMTLYLVEPRRQGQKRGRRKPLPPEVRRAVLLTLTQSNCKLSSGVAALRQHSLLPSLEWACTLPMFTDQILVWHIVTTCCDWASGPRRGDDDDDHHQVIATTLSNYCAYLVAFLPEMLPDPSYHAQLIFDTAVQKARDHLQGCRTPGSILASLEQIADTEREYLRVEGEHTYYDRAGSANVIERAAVLWSQLKAGIATDAQRWRLLANFWSEFVLFLAPSDNVDIHGRMLDSGGEFMTQLWALLSHAGVLERPPGQRSRGGGWYTNLLNLLLQESEQRSMYFG